MGAVGRAMKYSLADGAGCFIMLSLPVAVIVLP